MNRRCEEDSGRLGPPGPFFARASFTAVIHDASSTRVRPFSQRSIPEHIANR
ncbi:MAG: hypothetical protein P4L33_08345 [Capsulimonadaceae bacterium]|nr:hypothetical protein [Capsulimonadaceae bacterium]